MRIEKIILENFQSHKHTVLDLDAAITLVTGSSDSGKSALVRALRWVFFNRAPKGNFMLDKKKITRVTLTYETGEILIREQGRNLNQYRLNGDVYRALRSDVPPEVRNFHKVTLDNCQWQHPHLFLLDDTAGNVAKKLNEVADLSIMDEALTVINALIRESDADVNKIKVEIERLDKGLTETVWVPEAEQEIARTETMVQEYTKKISWQERIKFVIADVNKTKARLEQFPDLSGLPAIDEALEKWQQGKQLNDVMERLMDSLRHIEDLEDKLEGMPDVDVAGVDAGISLIERSDRLLADRERLAEKVILVEDLQEKLSGWPDVDVAVDVEGFENRKKTLTYDRSHLKGVLANVGKWQGKLKVAEIALIDAEEAYDKLKEELGVCPVCGNKFK